MKQLLFACALLLTLASPARAAINEESAYLKPQIDPNLRKGNVEADLALSFELNSRVTPYTDARTTNFVARGELQYFVADELSVGVLGSLATSGVRGGYNSVGLVASKYFLVRDNLAPYVSLAPGIFVNRSDTDADWASGAEVGAKYFLNRFAAIGPAVHYTHFWGRGANESNNRLSFMVGFSLHL